MTDTNSRSFGGRYRAVEPGPPAAGVASGPQERNGGSKQESVLGFVTYFYNLIRDDAAMVGKLDRAVKERYADHR